jgi:hypothetical protein
MASFFAAAAKNDPKETKETGTDRNIGHFAFRRASANPGEGLHSMNG